MASLKDVLGKLGPEHIFSRSVVVVGRILQMRESPSRLNTRGVHIVASPMDAVSSGTGTIYSS